MPSSGFKRMKLKGKIAVITGACRGIGQAIAEEYAREGAHLILVARSQKIHEAAKKISTPVLTMTGDISSPFFVEKLFKNTIERFGGLDILVNNAGVQGPIGPLETIKINLFGTFLMCR